MLVLSRRVGERIVIGPNVVLTVLEVRGEAVKLGFVAPGEVPVHREEVHRRLAEQGRTTLTRAGQAEQPESRPAESPFFAECA